MAIPMHIVHPLSLDHVCFFLLDGNHARTELKCSSTQSEAGAWWVVDLGESYSIGAVAITTVNGKNDKRQ